MFVLKNGATVLIRPARASDAGALQAQFHRLTPDEVYTRFFRALRSLSYAELQTLCNVNHETEVAFLAVTAPRESEVAGAVPSISWTRRPTAPKSPSW